MKHPESPTLEPNEKGSPHRANDEGSQTSRKTHHHIPSDSPPGQFLHEAHNDASSIDSGAEVIYGLPSGNSSGYTDAKPGEVIDTEVPAFPGIDPEIVRAAKIRKCGWMEAVDLVGLPQAGILIPYFKLDGSPVYDPERHYCRLRLDHPENGKKYHQPSKTRVHTYITPNFAALVRDAREIFVVEGEKKALALASEGMPALGMSGFYGCMNGPGCWTEEFNECLRAANPIKINFIGDQDVLFNAQFSDAVSKVADLLNRSGLEKVKLRVVVVPPDAPEKGVDDCRGVLGEEFRIWFEQIVAKSILVGPGESKGAIALELLNEHRSGLVEAGKKQCVGEGLAKLAAGIGDPLSVEDIKRFAEGFGIKPRPFGQLVKAARTKQASSTVPEGVASDTVIDLSEPTGNWTRRALERIAQDTYLTSDVRLARLCGRYLEPFDAKSLPSYLDRPEVACFTKSRADDTRVVAKFAKNDAELVLGSVLQNREILRPVRFVSSIPVLVEKEGGGVEIVQTYDRTREILVTGEARSLPQMSLHDAIGAILTLFKDFAFARLQDCAAVFALILTPALVRGGFLGAGRVPFFLVIKDQKGAGGSLLCQLISALYDHPPEAITFREPGKAHEAISSSLFKGASIVYLDNLRGNVLTDLPFFESLLTEPNFAGRMLYRDGSIDVRSLVTMATSNGVTLSEDLADRTMEIQIRKQPLNHQFHKWPEGDIIGHIAANRTHYLSCIYSIIQHWVAAGKPGGPTTGLRFNRWEAAVSGILQRYPGTPLQLFPDGARGRQRTMSRMASPDFEEIESICRTLCAREQAGNWLTAADILRVTEHETFWEPDILAGAARTLGMKLKKFCEGEGDFHDVGEDYLIQHRKQTLPENNYKETNQYCVYRSDQFR